MIRRLPSASILLLVCVFSSAQTTPAPGTYLDVGGVKLWYEECGLQNSHAVVLLHDGLLHSITWDGIWPSLCAKYHVVRYDRRGYGRSEPAKTPFVPEDDLLKIMRQVHMDHAIIVGNSSGGGLALDFALAHPEMVEGLFLIGPVVHGMASSDYFNERGSRNSAPLDRGDDRAVAENWSKDRFLIAGDDPPARKELYDGLSQNPQNLKVDGGLEVRPSPPTVVRLSEIHVPTLILVGDTDIADVFAYSGAIEAAAPLASFEVWKDTGHLIQLQRPTELVARFNRFVSLAERKEVGLTPGQLGAYVGWYKLGNHLASVTLKNNRLLVEIPGNPYYWLFAASEARFFLRTEETEIEFQRDAGGKVIEMVVHNSDGSVIRCPRVKNGSSQ
jgi:pimeloyl-ACP methyl ester carboxylesterase